MLTASQSQDTRARGLRRIERHPLRLVTTPVAGPVASLVTERCVECRQCSGAGVEPCNSFGDRCRLCRGARELLIRVGPLDGEWVGIVADGNLYTEGCLVGIAPAEADAFSGPGWWLTCEPCRPSNHRHRQMLAAVGCSL